MFPWVYPFCTQNTVNSWISCVSSSGSVQRIIRNSRELVLGDTDSLKVGRIPGSLRCCHMPRATRAGPWGCCCPFWADTAVQCGGVGNWDIISSPGKGDWFLSFLYLRYSLCFLPFWRAVPFLLWSHRCNTSCLPPCSQVLFPLGWWQATYFLHIAKEKKNNHICNHYRNVFLETPNP